MSETCDKYFLSDVKITGAVFAILFCIVGVIGNLVTILALVRCPRLRGHATTTFVISLCVSDLLFCVYNMPLTAHRYIHGGWLLGETLCVIFPVLFYGNVALSMANMVAITINRYILIAHNHLYNVLYTNVSVCLQMLSAWVLAFLIMLPPLLGIWGTLGKDLKTCSCTILKKDDASPKQAIFIAGFGIPCVIIILAYSCIYWEVRKSTTRVKRDQQHGLKVKRVTRRDKDDRRLTNLMLIIFLSFILCFLPLTIVNVVDKDDEFPQYSTMASILAWSASVINPFLYAGTNRQYRQAYKKLFNIFGITLSTESRGETRSRDQSVNLKTNVVQ